MEQKQKWALISVFKKDGIVDFAERIVKMGWKIISSSGTARMLAGAGIEVKDVADWVGGEAILGHKVVTLSRKVHAALLADPKLPEEMQTIADMNLSIIDMVVCDFYPLAVEIAKLPQENSETEFNGYVKNVIEKTDIGGSTMVRSGGKGGRVVICRFQDREPVIKELEKHKTISTSTRQKLRATAEYMVAGYCLDSARFHGSVGWDLVHGYVPLSTEPICSRFDGMIGELVQTCKYGENAWQTHAGLYSTGSDDPLALDKFKAIGGTEPSYNNLCDIYRLLQTLTHVESVFKLNWDFRPDIMIGVKHGNPCGAAVNIGSPDKRMELARRVALGDKLAIFGGWIMANFGISGSVATALVKAGMRGSRVQKFDGIVAPRFGPGTTEPLKRAGGKCRLMTNSALGDPLQLDTSPMFRCVRGGFLVQPNYTFVPKFSDMQVYGRRNRNLEMSLALAWAVGCTSNSNTITIVKNKMLIGNGVGQQARIWASKLAVDRAMDAQHKSKLEGAVAYSDSFFPYPDAVKALIDYGIKAIFTTSGSRTKGGGDKATIKACKEAGVTLYMLPDKKARGFFAH